MAIQVNAECGCQHALLLMPLLSAISRKTRYAVVFRFVLNLFSCLFFRLHEIFYDLSLGVYRLLFICVIESIGHLYQTMHYVLKLQGTRNVFLSHFGPRMLFMAHNFYFQRSLRLAVICYHLISDNCMKTQNSPLIGEIKSNSS